MENRISAFDCFSNVFKCREVAFNNVGADLSDLLGLTVAWPDQTDYFITVIDEAFGDVGPNAAGDASNQDSQFWFLGIASLTRDIASECCVGSGFFDASIDDLSVCFR